MDNTLIYLDNHVTFPNLKYTFINSDCRRISWTEVYNSALKMVLPNFYAAGGKVGYKKKILL